MSHKGWRSRGYLPHFDSAEVIQHVVFGLADAFPSDHAAPEDSSSRQQWRDDELDNGLGACLLVEQCALIVEDALLHFDGSRYRLWAWCVMPNHVHALVAPINNFALGTIVHSWKSFSANGVNRALNRSGRLWRREYFDHFIRNEKELDRTAAYIEHNPVKAGLAATPETWRWSSAWAGER